MRFGLQCHTTVRRHRFRLLTCAGVLADLREGDLRQHRIRLLEREIEEYYLNFRIGNDLIELRNLVMTAHLIVRSAMQRHESRGLHFSRDYPETSAVASPTILRPRRGRHHEELHAATA